MAYQSSLEISIQELAGPVIGPFQLSQEERYLRQKRLANLGRYDNIVRVNHHISQIRHNCCGICKFDMCTNNSLKDFVVEMETNFFLNVHRTLLCNACFRSVQELTVRPGCDNIWLTHEDISSTVEQQRYQFGLSLISNKNMVHEKPFPGELLRHYEFMHKQLNEISKRSDEFSSALILSEKSS